MSSRSSGDYRRRKRKRLFEQQKGLCFWCRVEMVLINTPQHIKHPPPNMATLEHLDDRFSPERGTFGNHQMRRVVLACYHCNHTRGKRRQAQQPIEELRRRAGQSTGSRRAGKLKGGGNGQAEQ